VAVVVAIVLTRGGGTSSTASSPPITFAFESEQPVAVPQTIGDFQLEPPTNTSSTTPERDSAGGAYLSTSTPRRLLQYQVFRAVDVNRGPEARTQEAQRLANLRIDGLRRDLFTPDVSQETVTRGTLQYTCLSGATTTSTSSTSTFCEWTDGVIAYTIGLTPQASAEAVVDLGAQAQEGTRK